MINDDPFKKVEEQFVRLKGQADSGQITDEQFRAALQELMAQDSQGRYWTIGANTGKWYVNEGNDWREAEPHHSTAPIPPAPPIQPPAPPPVPPPPAMQAPPPIQAPPARMPVAPPPPYPPAPPVAKSGSRKWLIILPVVFLLLLCSCVCIFVFISANQ